METRPVREQSRSARDTLQRDSRPEFPGRGRRFAGVLVLTIVAVAMLALMAVVTVGGAISQNHRAGALLREKQERVFRVAATIGVEPARIHAGREIYAGTCTACHGLNGEAKPGLGKDLVNSTFMRGLSDTGLLQFLKLGRSTWDPMNTTGVEMPGKGGNPALTDDDLRAVVAYMRFLQASSNPNSR